MDKSLVKQYFALSELNFKTIGKQKQVVSFWHVYLDLSWLMAFLKYAKSLYILECGAKSTTKQAIHHNKIEVNPCHYPEKGAD